MRLTVTVLLALCAQVGSASAPENRIEFITLAGDTRVAGSEACFFPADSVDDFFAKFLSTSDVRCLSADAVLSLARGSFNVFARNGSTLIDSHPTVIDNRNPGEPGYRAVALPLSPAATLDLSAARAGLRDGEWLVVYLTNESRAESLASIQPLPRGEKKMLVPADMPLLPMVVRRGAIVRVGRPMQLPAGETMSVPPVDQWGTGRDVVALVSTDALTAPDVPRAAPHLELRAGTAEPLRPVFALRGAGRFDGSLAIFKDVPAGAYQVRLFGEGWQTDEATAITTSAMNVMTARPLMARMAATVEVRASVGVLGTIPPDAQCPGADPVEPQSDRPTLRLLRCDHTDGSAERPPCAPVRELSFEPRQAELVRTWSDLAPGVYVAELAYRFLTERSGEVEVRPGRAGTLTVALRADTVSGRVKHGDSPVQAMVSFPHSIVPALSDDAGNYTALVANEPQRGVVTVRMCRGGVYRYRPAKPIGNVLDIDIPKNELVVRVVDERGRPLADASVYGGPLFPEGDTVYTFLPFAPTDAAGETRFANVVADADVQLCAGLPGHAPQCAEEFRMGDRALHRIRIALSPLATMNGRLSAQKPFVGGTIYLVSPAGAIVDRSVIAPAGEFTLRKTGTPGEYLVSDSLSHPLAVFELPLDRDRPLEFEMPIQSRTLDVTLSPKSLRRIVALELAGRVIPSEVLLKHQMMRQLVHVVEPGASLAFRDLGPGSLAVYSVPLLGDAPPEWTGLDPIEHPHLRAALPRVEVTGPAVVLE